MVNLGRERVLDTLEIEISYPTGKKKRKRILMDDEGDLDTLIQRFLSLKNGTPSGIPDLEGSFQDDDLLTTTSRPNSDFQWSQDEELGIMRYGETTETGTPLCIGISTDYYDLTSLDRRIQPTQPEGIGIRGEGIASVTGSILRTMAEYQDSISISGQEESQDLNDSMMDMSICKSENLFSPLHDNQPELPALSTFSTDSLDIRKDLIATCAATNHNNYTIVFNPNNNLEDSSNPNTTTPIGTTTPRQQQQILVNWNTMNPDSSRSKPNSNNNGTSSSSSSQWTVDNTSHLLTQSCPHDVPNHMLLKRRLFDLRRRTERTSDSSGGAGGSDRSSIPTLSSEEDESVENYQKWRQASKQNRLEKAKPTTTAHVAQIITRSIEIQTSASSYTSTTPSSEPSGEKSSPAVYVCYPNYTLPDLNFLSQKAEKETGMNGNKDVFLIPHGYKAPLRDKQLGSRRTRRPLSCNDIQDLKSRDLSGIRDWPSLSFLLPEEYRTILRDIQPKKESTDPIEGERRKTENVVLRKRFRGTDIQQRWSLGGDGGTLPGNFQPHYRRHASKRFSLQEPIIPEINEITNEISRNLRDLDELDTEIFSEPAPPPPVPQNTPKISYIENRENQEAGISYMRRVTRSHQIPDLAEKEGLSENIIHAVEEMTRVVRPIGGVKTYSQLMISSGSPAGKLLLEVLCPALYSLLSDGLCPYLDTIFGKIPNTVWRVIEGSIQYGPTPTPLNDLIMKINSEELLAEGPIKFNAFISGLLNLGNLSSWLLFLRTKERLLRTHYDTDSFLFLCNTGTRILYDRMVEHVNHLTKLPFQLDIFHEAKLLHQSMLMMAGKKDKKSRLHHGSSGVRSSSAPSSKKYTTPGVDSNKLTLMDTNKGISSKHSKFYANQLKKTQMKRSFSDERPAPPGTGLRLGSSIPKSKTSQNIQLDESNRTVTLRKHHSNKTSAATNVPRRYSSDREKGIMEPMKKVPTERPKSLGQFLETDSTGGGSGSGSGERQKDKDAEKFHNLRLQWELLTSDEVKGRAGGLPSPQGQGSKIPRPITSPHQAGIPHFGIKNTTKR